MPSGRVHLRLDLMVLTIFIGLLYTYKHLLSQFKDEEILTFMIIFVLSYSFSSLFLSPDLDLFRSRSRTNWGILIVLWWPYSRIFKHRGLSHSIVFGTLTRIVYLALAATALITIIHYVFDLDIDISKIKPRDIDIRIAIAVLMGLYLPNVIHILADRISRRQK